jgi:hypothetical protein
MSVKIKRLDNGRYAVTITDGDTSTTHECKDIVEAGTLIDKMEAGRLEAGD